MRWVAGTPVWTALNPVPVRYGQMTGDLHTEVVVIGGGIDGALTAYKFVEAGAETVLVEQNIIGHNSTAVSTAILQYEIDTDMDGLQRRYGLDTAVRAFKLCEGAVEEVGTISHSLDDTAGFRTVPCLYYSDKPKDVSGLRREFDLRQQHGFAVEYIDPVAAAGRFAFPVQAGIYSTKGAAEIDPYRFTCALIRAATQRGLRVYERTEITEVEPGIDSVRLLTKGGFFITAKRAIFATGYAARTYITSRPTALLTRSFSLVTRSYPDVSGWPERCIIRDNGEPYTYLRNIPGSRILIGGQDVDIEHPLSEAAILDGHDSLSLNQYQWLLERLNRLFPNLQVTESDIEYRFSGIFADTKDSLPFIGEYEPMPGCYFNMGYGANGILYNLIGAKLLVELYQGARPADLALFGFDR